MVLVYDTGKYGHSGEWIMLSKTSPKKVLYIFGRNKPTKEAFLKQEKRVQYFKNLGPVHVNSYRRNRPRRK